MKNVIALALRALGITVSWIVYYPANGLFTSIGTTFTTRNGAAVTRGEAPYLLVAAVQKTTDNFLSVSTDGTTGQLLNSACVVAVLSAMVVRAIFLLQRDAPHALIRL